MKCCKVTHLAPTTACMHLYFAQNAIDDPVCRGCTDRIAGANDVPLEMSHDFAEQGDLNMLRIFDFQVTVAVFALHMNGGVGENRKRNLAAVANQEDAIFFHAFVSHETPSARSRHAICESKSSAHCVFRGVKSTAVGRVAGCFHDGAKQLLEQIQLVWG